MVDARDESESWHAQLSISAQEGTDLLQAPGDRAASAITIKLIV
jgi:hypothetical protein